jgi:tRNA modification GTPase
VDERGVYDEALLVWMPGPRSFTGEDTAEISCHGHPLLVERLIGACVDAGARPALPGEFTRRAFLSGRIDLCRAEALLQVMEATGPRAQEMASRGLLGAMESWREARRTELIDAAASTEALLDHPEACLEFDLEATITRTLTDCLRELRKLTSSFAREQTLLRGARVALVGPVNAGKSSLFNRLLGSARAIVDERPGTTRDIVEACLVTDGVALVLLDTAGERESSDPVENAGLQLRDLAMVEADLLLLVLPAHLPEDPSGRRLFEKTRGLNRLIVANHSDRPGATRRLYGEEAVATSALEGTGIEDLRVAILGRLLSEEPGEVPLLLASQRQREILLGVSGHVQDALAALEGQEGAAIAAEEIHAALTRLHELEGRSEREEVLDRLFSRFCVGK